jgi:hypothetical protein
MGNAMHADEVVRLISRKKTVFSGGWKKVYVINKLKTDPDE